MNNFDRTLQILTGDLITEAKTFTSISKDETTKIYTGKIPSRILSLIDPETKNDVTGVAILNKGKAGRSDKGDIWITTAKNPESPGAKWNPYDVNAERKFK